MKQSILYIVLLGLLVSSCSDKRMDLLQGHWEAKLLMEESDTVNLDLSPVFLEMNANGTYRFQSTLNYQESGRFHLEGPMLNIQDTTSIGSSERRMRIHQFEADTLILDMESDGRNRQLTLWRKK